MKVLLFEGIDKVGKTTTIKTLEDNLKEKGYKVIKIELPFICNKINTEERTFRLEMTVNNIIEIDKYFSDDNTICLVDRLYLSERVYGAVLRNGNFDNFKCNLFDYKISRLDTTLIHVRPLNLLHNFNKFKDENGMIDGLTYQQYSDTYNAFIEEVRRSAISKKVEVTTDKLKNIEKILCL